MSVNYTPRTWTAGLLVNETHLNTEIRDLSNGLQGAWTTYSPTLTNITVGNGTQSARYMQVGKTIKVFYKLTLGSTSSVGNASISLPVTALDTDWSIGGTAFDTSASARYAITAFASSTTTLAFRALSTGGQLVVFSGTVPFGAAFATGDIVVVSGDYEAA